MSDHRPDCDVDTNGGDCNCLGAALARIAELERERDEARTERDFFDAERVKVVAQLEAAEAALAAEKEGREKAEAKIRVALDAARVLVLTTNGNAQKLVIGFRDMLADHAAPKETP